MDQKHVYLFGPGKAEGNKDMKDLLGGKGANLAEMSRVGLPVPPGLTLTATVCNRYGGGGTEQLVQLVEDELLEGLSWIESVTSTRFGDPDNPCLVSVRSGARVSMPGMMDTILNLGLNDDAVQGLARQTGNDRFAWDSYRRFIQMYADVVLKINREAEHGRDVMEQILEDFKSQRGVEADDDLTTDDLKELVARFKSAVERHTGSPFPMDPKDQLWQAIASVFDSWHTPRARYYRKIHDIPEEWCTAVNVQAMVFGNKGMDSASGVAFTRDPGTGEDKLVGEYLFNAQGEDVVAGIRTPKQISVDGSRKWAEAAGIDEADRAANYPSLEEAMPAMYRELRKYRDRLETHYKEMQDLEFTIEEGKLWILQTRTGKRTGRAMVRIGMDMLRDFMIDEVTVLKRIDPEKLNELLHPVFDESALNGMEPVGNGMPASPGAASGQIVFSSDKAAEWKEDGKEVILVRIETSADDLQGMDAANGVLTARGGMTSHAAVVARGMGKCCISGVGAMEIDHATGEMTLGGVTFREGDWISLNGTTGNIYSDRIETRSPELDQDLEDLMTIADQYARLGVKTNADTPESAQLARKFGARGIGLCRTEHMFFGEDRIQVMRAMILAESEAERKNALDRLLPMQREDFTGIFRAMEGFPVTIRLMDPPLHEFLPSDAETQAEVAEALDMEVEAVADQVEKLSEVNPMMGHRGCRLTVTFPEITAMQTRAILEAAVTLAKEKVDVRPEIMVPLIGTVEEFEFVRAVIRAEAERVFDEQGMTIDYRIGTMIEIPRAAMAARSIAVLADFFSFGTNDLTQMTYGFSRDDAGKFLPEYIEKGILKRDPFRVIDTEGVGGLMELCVRQARKAKQDLTIGICGEHGGDPESIAFCHGLGLEYVSCSPFRVPIARIAAAQAAL